MRIRIDNVRSEREMDRETNAVRWKYLEKFSVTFFDSTISFDGVSECLEHPTK